MNISLAEKVRYPFLPNQIKKELLEEFFTITKEDEYFLRKVKQKKNLLALALLLKVHSYLHYFPFKMSNLPNPIINHVAKQLKKDPSELKSYDNLRSVKQYHSKIIRKYLGFSTFEDKAEIVNAWIYEHASKTDIHIDIVKESIRRIIVEKIELPSLSAIEKLASSAVRKANKNLFDRIEQSLSAEQKLMIESLIRESEGSKASELRLLKIIPGRANINTLHDQIKLLKKLKAFNITNSLMRTIPVNKRQLFADQGTEYNIRDLRNFNAERRHAILSCFIYRNYTKTTDNIISIMVKIVRGMHNKSIEKFETIWLRKIAKSASNFRILEDLTGIILEYIDEDGRILKKKLVDYKSVEEYRQINLEAKRISGTETDHYALLINYYGYLRRFSKIILNTLEFNSNIKNNRIIMHIDILKKNLHNSPNFKLNPDFVHGKWRKYVFDKSGKFNQKFFELYVISEIANSLASDEIWVKDSEEYGSLYDHLMPREKYDLNKKKYYEELRLDMDPEKFVSRTRSSHITACNKFESSLPKNKYARIKDGKLSITPLDRKDEPQSIAGFRQEVFKRMGYVDLSNILIDVQNWLDFCEYFKHLGGKVKKNSKATIERLLATLHSYGCNLGPSQTERSTKFGRKQIIETKKKYFTEKNLIGAKNEIVNRYNMLDVTNWWGDGTSSSSDGRMIRSYEDNLTASFNIKYKATGAMVYNLINDKQIALCSILIPCTVYEAEYVLDTFFDEDSQIETMPEIIHVDTHGQTEVLFGFCHLLGMQLMPRIKNIGDCILYKPKEGNYKNIGAILKNATNWKLIKDNYDNMMWMMASMQEGYAKPSFLLKKMSSYNKTNPAFMAFRELGLVARTMYIMQYASSKQIRRMVQVGCNKSEQWNAFQKFIYFARNGEINTNDFMTQRKSISALELVSNCVCYWTAFVMDQVVKQMKKEGKNVKYSDVSYISPLSTQHITRYGKFEFDLEKRKNKVMSNAK